MNILFLTFECLTWWVTSYFRRQQSDGNELDFLYNLMSYLLLGTIILCRFREARVLFCRNEMCRYSWHCDICQTCYKQRSHHCILLGMCISIDNIEEYFYFILMETLFSIFTIYLLVVRFLYCFSFTKVEICERSWDETYSDGALGASVMVFKHITLIYSIYSMVQKPSWSRMTSNSIII
ncbi:unnamed protein product [Blepharisma stoltei]|uniref:Palmitoyltransferase n=1 Tax=Blepharisma stoltei TaxID=1481888 RepID=A0AAU9JBR4_9CILI|nr:unnamed protein product [Blepharisma stoltei]